MPENKERLYMVTQVRQIEVKANDPGAACDLGRSVFAEATIKTGARIRITELHVNEAE